MCIRDRGTTRPVGNTLTPQGQSQFDTKKPARVGPAGFCSSAFLDYCVIDFTASPTLKPSPETGVHTADASSTSVALTTPTLVVKRRMTAPVAGSLISLV